MKREAFAEECSRPPPPPDVGFKELGVYLFNVLGIQRPTPATWLCKHADAPGAKAVEILSPFSSVEILEIVMCRSCRHSLRIFLAVNARQGQLAPSVELVGVPWFQEALESEAGVYVERADLATWTCEHYVHRPLSAPTPPSWRLPYGEGKAESDIRLCGSCLEMANIAKNAWNPSSLRAP